MVDVSMTEMYYSTYGWQDQLREAFCSTCQIDFVPNEVHNAYCMHMYQLVPA
jgi:hypothetical protein